MFPDTGTLYFYLGQLHAEASQMDRALEIWHQGISLEPSYQEIIRWPLIFCSVSPNGLGLDAF